MNIDIYRDPTLTKQNSSNFHQTLHLETGFIGEPAGQEKSLANSGELEKAPMTLNSPGE